ncbi:DUF3999 family protein [Luteimonas yindakuii]|uniref:DUF3999 family protein n=1 Tax=Luteimonas yindakuii TaxID=2565782 RepID=A0A4Z1R334_9GAMM|nr:DUF3999 domain-containing protein [Luteimonas yindakuii]TKS53356.1 DUF3999 family protein [Luteimonas yindakuii]
MIRTLARSVAAFALSVPLAVAASAVPVGSDYGWQWPLSLSAGDAGAYRVELTPDIYAAAWSPTLADVIVVNGDGHPVPSTLVDATVEERPVLREVPWFPLPGGRAQRDIAAISEIDTDGRLRRVELRGAEDAATAWLLDASQLDGGLLALRLSWADSQPAFEQVFRVEASDDLKQWQPVQPEARVFDLRRDDARLLQGRIAFTAPTQARYLRLLPLRASMPALQLTAVQAEVRLPEAASSWQWRALAPRAVRVDGRDGFEYRLDGRYPVTRVDLATAGNASSRWTLSVRDRDDAPWRVVATDWVVYRLGADADSRSPPQLLPAPLRDRAWRLEPESPVAAPPDLLLGYRPEALVFVAEGTQPFAVYAGSARAKRAAAPVTQMLDALRTRHGADWRPAAATPGSGTALAGEAALTPSRDWTTWVLWTVLLAGVAVVAGFAVSLLRRGSAPTG